MDTAAAVGPGAGFYTVVVSNNDEAQWRGSVRVAATAPGAPSALAECVELRAGSPVALNPDERSFSIAVDGFDVAVVRCGASW